MKTVSAIIALAASASAHIVMTNPKAFPQKDNGPLLDSGSNYPCGATSYDGAPTSWKAGETKQITFMGGATHSGGSCQFSITPDTKPSKDSQFKVLHSVHGGCISTKPGNERESAEYTTSNAVPVTLPEDLPAGQYTFSWSWLNKSGNREFYQNCAPITVQSSSKKSVAEAIGGLPDMFVVNLSREVCKTTEGQDFVYPNPGKSVTKGSPQSPNFGSTLTGADAACAKMNKMGAGNGKLGSPGAGTPSTPPSTPTKPATPPPANTGIVGAPSPTPQPQPQNPTPANPPATGSVPCKTDGSIVCIGSSQWGLCNMGSAVPQALAAGTKCSNGAISRRSVRAPRRHLARSHGNNLI
ncbi:hypothetical protein B0J11DRAFT_156240 [Dendryphion nanum]|uniref:Lytic polysaccharide monooxygenase n=1 Tax=Dendryphion nanum TaxID=256645 RepID=A0A9P9EDR0_9PLEO|nr:hypothetical protein B0J11DRAFT_156240 [Dendryphion nanum]